MRKLISILKKTFSRIYSSLFNKYLVESYSQEGEDLVLSRIVNNRDKGFYVDVGAHHPMRFSNTYKFYKAGWRGINIEPNPDSFDAFIKHRPKDININCGVSEKETTLEYYMFDESALNTFDETVLLDRLQTTSYKHLKTVKIKVRPLASIIKESIPYNTKIDFLTVDVEGFDMEVIKSNDWENFRPSWVLVEQLNLEDMEKLDFEIHVYMKSINYTLFAKTFNTLFYKDKNKQ